MSKFVIISLVAVLAVANARVTGDITDIQTNDLNSQEQEGRILNLLKVPTISVIILKSLKGAWFLLTTLCSLIDYKLAALAIAVKVGTWLLSFKFPVLVGAALMLGFCKVSGLCAFHGIFAAETPNHLDYASDYLDIGTLKYGQSS